MAADLPFIDRHSVEIAAEPAAVWDSLTGTFGNANGQGPFMLYARVIGVNPQEAHGDLDRVGSSRVGFRVAEVRAPEMLKLTGKHRFSNYSLTWELTPRGAGHSRLSAITHAEFPGVHGRLYKSVVIDSGAHKRITRRMLSAIALKATSN